MSIEEALARLTAGLDRDEAIARAAAELDAEGASWRVRKVRDDGMYVFGDNQSAPSGGKFGFEEDAQTEHMQSHDPARVLRQVEAIREVIADYALHSDAKYPDFEGGYASALEDVIDALAGIYAEPTDTEGGTP